MDKNLMAQVLTGTLIDENDHDYFVQIEGETFQLDKAEIKKPFKMGASFTGFTYENEQHKMQITRQIPKIRRDHYDFGTVVKGKFGLGVFVDIGLPNKDIVVSVDDLPTVSQLWPREGDQLLISLTVDNKARIWGHLADEEIFEAIARPVNGRLQNKDIKARAYRLKMAGTRLLTADYHLAFLHPSERLTEPRLGEEVEARVIGMLRDGSINLSTRPRAYQEIGEDAEMILAALEHTASKKLDFSDKSAPADIKDYFGISKGAFKRALGHLLKENLITQENNQIILKKRED
ncbi:S1 RNA-binding domain-containing protein [Lentilactobacillus farraginis]|uniref:RNA-binding protein n=1 Tax=Lentilactobacillus farraginis DSM 18382 = JCM 14108 TaxID=1423743 RepID=X0PG82_9LACO|nr:S1-like domain-containing RNA-binding protein [Lentilactobacillus farraginis]KRM11585.1 RNA-binding protein [Lentilactobacillus farraginis DSM 18382 = JCM 14108]GAF35386.1 S1 RNA binding domain [Lentilactobacillus farraginis DSM 18382 = JCM 14108]